MAIAAQFTQYPAWVAWYAADPIKGIPRQLKFRVTVADVAEFCARVYGEHIRDNERAKQIERQLAQRALPPPSDDEARERALENQKARFGEHFGIEQHSSKAVSIPPIETVMAQYPGGALKGLTLSDAALAKVKGEAA